MTNREFCLKFQTKPVCLLSGNYTIKIGGSLENEPNKFHQQRSPQDCFDRVQEAIQRLAFSVSSNQRIAAGDNDFDQVLSKFLDKAWWHTDEAVSKTDAVERLRGYFGDMHGDLEAQVDRKIGGKQQVTEREFKCLVRQLLLQ